MKYVWYGVAGAIAVATAGWSLLQFITALTARSFTAQETIGGLMSIAAVCFVTGMIFWMRKASRTIASELRERLGQAVAVGILAYGFHDLQEAGILPGLNTVAFDISHVVPPTSWYGVLLKGIFNFNPRPTVVELMVWLEYLLPVMTFYLRPAGPPPPRKAEPAPAAASTNA